MTETLLTAKHAGLLLGLTSSGVRRLDEVGDLKAVRDSTGRRLFAREDVERLKQKREGVAGQRRPAEKHERPHGGAGGRFLPEETNVDSIQPNTHEQNLQRLENDWLDAWLALIEAQRDLHDVENRLIAASDLEIAMRHRLGAARTGDVQ
jgi:hypothetical protein